MKKFYFDNSSQSLIETLIAVAVAALAIIAIASLGQAFLNLGGQSEERVLATNLAREGLEVAQAIKMSYELNPDPEKDWLKKFAEGSYRLQWNSENLDDLLSPDNLTIEDCTNCLLCLEGETGGPPVYTHNCSSYEGAVFKRIVKVENFDEFTCVEDGTDCARRVISTVCWSEKGNSHKVSLELILTDWRD